MSVLNTEWDTAISCWILKGVCEF